MLNYVSVFISVENMERFSFFYRFFNIVEDYILLIYDSKITCLLRKELSKTQHRI